MANPKKGSSENFQKNWAHILKRTTTDEVFKQRLIQNPNQVLKENGIEVPPGVNVKIVENTTKTCYYVLPEAHFARDLSEEQLRKVAGGMQIIYSAGGGSQVVGS